MSAQATRRDHRQEPTYWFAVLEISRERHDHERAAEAIRELRRLGVQVRFTQRKEAARG
jgi:hypothetical protein